MQGFDTFNLVAQIAWRNLLANRWKTLIVGGIIGFGALLVVVGMSLLSGVEHAMSRSIVGSIAGHIQMYSRASKDDLDVMGGFSSDAPDVAPFDFSALKTALKSVPNVAAVVPMGISSALVTAGNSIDQALSRLRKTVMERKAGDTSEGIEKRYRAEVGLARQMTGVLKHDLENVRKVAKETALSPEEYDAIAKTASDEFWSSFDDDPLSHLEFLENRIAPIAADADMLFLRYVGTDPVAFARHFDRMQVVDGQAIPEGQRGFLFSKYMYEEQIKLKVARGLDKLKKARDLRHSKIADNPDLQRIVRENSTGVRELLLQLDALKSDAFRAKLQAFLPSQEPDLGKLLSQFFHTSDENFDRRYAFFYKELAPSLELYRVRIGDTLTIKAFTRSGYVQSASLKVYGTYAFRGLEESPQAGALNMMDLVSFRELYGFMTADRQREIDAMRAASGAKDVSRETIEADLFGAPAQPEEAADAQKPAAAPSEGAPGRAAPAEAVRGQAAPSEAASAQAAPGQAAPREAGSAQAASAQAAPGQPVSAQAAPGQAASAQAAPAAPEPDDALASLKGTRRGFEQRGTSYDPSQLEEGVVLNAAVIVHDESKIDETMVAAEKAAERAGLSMYAISWQKAAGLLGQFATLMRAVLYAAVLIIFMVGLVVINNALVMATLERVGELGTLRAIGAQRRLLLSMLIAESGMVGLCFGLLGALIGAAILVVLGHVGIPAANDVFTFFFSGSRLYPGITAQELLLALGIVLVVSIVSGIYPALVAMRVSPRQAMQAEE